MGRESNGLDAMRVPVTGDPRSCAGEGQSRRVGPAPERAGLAQTVAYSPRASHTIHNGWRRAPHLTLYNNYPQISLTELWTGDRCLGGCVWGQ